jgi:transposase-like protein
LSGVELIVSDAHKGIQAAIAKEFQGVGWQRCQVHFKREALKKVSYKRYKELAHDLRHVFSGETEQDCLVFMEATADKWEKCGVKRVSEQLREGTSECLTVLTLPEERRRRLNSTNMLERVMRELKRRTRVVGIFPNTASCYRPIGALLLELHEEWQLESRPYVNMALQ